MKISGIYPEVFVTVLCAVLIPLVVGGAYVFISERDAVRERVDRQLEQVATVVETRVDGWGDANDRVIIQNTLLPDIKSMVAERQVPILRGMVRALDWVFLSSVVAGDAHQVSRNDGGKLVDYSDRAYFHQALAHKTLANQVVLSKTTGEPVLVLARGFSTDTGSQAVLLISSNLRDIAQAIKTARLGKTGYAFLLDENGKVISHPKVESSGKLLDMSTNAAFLATRGTPNWRGAWTEGDPEYLGYAQVTKMGWVIVVQQELAEAYAPVQSAAIKATLITVLGSVHNQRVV